jgi:hypothetical protein
MRNSDETIERVLAGLRDAEAPAGMERRIVDTLRTGASERRRWSSTLLFRPLTFAAVSAIAVASIVCWIALGGHQTKHNNATSEKHAIPSNPQPVEVRVASASSIQPLSDKSPLRASSKITSPIKTLAPERKLIALPETRTANKPAPEAPLTDEEKLLLRIAHKNDPVELAALNPMLRAAEDAQEKAEVKTFF